jgi:hypothetical protein
MIAQIDAVIDELLRAQMRGQRGRQHQTRVGHRVVVVEGDL